MDGLLSIIVPVYDERATIATVLDRLLTIELPLPREIIVVDDGSGDGTAEVLDRLGACNPLLTIVHLNRNRGKGHAVRFGLARARGTVTVVQDADLELDPGQLASLIDPILRNEADAVYGSRFLPGSARVPVLTRWGNASLTWLANLLFRSSLTDMETCYKVMRGDVARSLVLTADGFDIEPEITAMLLSGGYRIIERPVTFSPRSKAAGKKIRWRDGVHAVQMLLKQRFGAQRE